LKNKRVIYSKLGSVVELPDLLEVQIRSFNNFLQKDVSPKKRKNIGLQALFNEAFPVDDIHGKYILKFDSYRIGQARYTDEEAIEKGVTYSAPLYVNLILIEKDIETGKERERVEQEVYLGDIPLMTKRADFVINGVERVVVNQIHRSPGVFFDEQETAEGRRTFKGEIIPYRGPWVEFSVQLNETIMVDMSRNRKFPVIILLRALGYETTEEILELFFPSKKISIKKGKEAEQKIIKRVVAKDVIDKKTGEVLIEAGALVSQDALGTLRKKKINSIYIVDVENDALQYMLKTIDKAKPKKSQDPMGLVYLYIRGANAPNNEIARNFVENMFFNPKRYSLSTIGRRKINKRFSGLKERLGFKTNLPNHKVPSDYYGLKKEDILHTINYLLMVVEGKGELDDIDHLGNRRMRSVGEQIENALRSGIIRLVSAIKEKMLFRDSERLTPQSLINVRLITGAINSFFGTSQLSQFMDQTNPIAELTHKRRISSLGPGGLTKQTAGFEVRDVHYTHYGRICPIETPEGPNIGLITSLTTYAKVNNEGLITTPYKKVEKGKIKDEIVYLTAEDEDLYTIAQANVTIKERKIKDKYVLVRRKGAFPLVKKEEVNFMDLSPRQLVSVSASLIPFLEHDDANRALMGSNMQRQSVPLLKPEFPLVGTGMEEKVARDSHSVIVAKRSGTVAKVTSSEIWINTGKGKLSLGEYDIYKLIKFRRTNQNTCINQRPIVKVGDIVKEGEIIADGPSTDRGELALGRNIFVAFMPYLGWNYEDAIVISEKLLKEDTFTSLHIEEFTCEVRDTKLGPEETTDEIPNVGSALVGNLGADGLIRIGAEVHPGDILVGKISPKGETELTPEEKLLKAIFGEKAADVKDTSLRVPSGVSGIVVNVKVLTRYPIVREEDKANIKRQYRKKIKDIQKNRDKLIKKRWLGKKAPAAIRDINGKLIIKKDVNFQEKHFRHIDNWHIPSLYKNIKKIASEARNIIQNLLYEEEKAILKLEKGDELPPGIRKIVKVFIGQRRRVSIGDKLSGRHGNKGVVSRIVPVEDMPYMEDGTPVDMVLNPLGVPSRMNVGQVLETHLGWACKELGIKIGIPVFEGMSVNEIKEKMREAGLPEDGKVVLYDGRTGVPFAEKITVGYMYMMKLAHMVDDKVHARSTGPYSLITQQPLGGKAQSGGQRFGEMEVWALESFGAAHTLQEMLTLKSDDILGRNRMYESIIKGENPPEPGIPASFHVLLKELNGLALNIELEKKTKE